MIQDASLINAAGYATDVAFHQKQWLLHLADNSLLLAQRNTAWCGHGPILEQDIALTNISLDLLGQAMNFYDHAAKLIGDTIADELAFLRTERDFKNCLLVEQPNGHWGQTILRQFFFSVYQYLLYQQLQQHSDTTIAAIATKSLKEVTYHVRWSSEWVIRLGDGTEESRAKMLQALEELWPYTGELFIAAAYESHDNIGFNLEDLKKIWLEKVQAILFEATLPLPAADSFMQTGGKNGIHSEHLGFILAELQYLQRTYPGSEW